MTVKIEKNVMFIELPMNPTPVMSASGKTLVVASTHGNRVTNAMVGGKPVILGINAYIQK